MIFSIILYSVHRYYSMLLCYFGNYYDFVINFYGRRLICTPVSIVLHKKKKKSVYILLSSCYMYFLLNVIRLHMKDKIQ